MQCTSHDTARDTRNDRYDAPHLRWEVRKNECTYLQQRALSCSGSVLASFDSATSGRTYTAVNKRRRANAKQCEILSATTRARSMAKQVSLEGSGVYEGKFRNSPGKRDRQAGLRRTQHLGLQSQRYRNPTGWAMFLRTPLQRTRSRAGLHCCTPIGSCPSWGKGQHEPVTETCLQDVDM